MSRLAGDAAVRSESAQRILLLMRSGRDRELLAEWLESLSQYEVVIRDPGDRLPTPDEYDLCILDTVAFDRSKQQLIDHQQETDPDFLPCLLITPKEAGDTITVQLSDDNGDEQTVINDVISMPVEQIVLRRRIENLLQARQAFLQLRERKEQHLK